jgi:hypothetical protein
MKTECKTPLSSGLSLEGSSRPATGQLARTSSAPTSPTTNYCCCSCYCRCVGTYRMTHAPDAMSSSSSTPSASKNATNSWNIQADQDILSQASRSLQLALVTESDTDNEDPPDKEVIKTLAFDSSRSAPRDTFISATLLTIRALLPSASRGCHGGQTKA